MNNHETTPVGGLKLPEGWALVPIKPTGEMIHAAHRAEQMSENEWAAMLAAAPAFPGAVQGEELTLHGESNTPPDVGANGDRTHGHARRNPAEKGGGSDRGAPRDELRAGRAECRTRPASDEGSPEVTDRAGGNLGPGFAERAISYCQGQALVDPASVSGGHDYNRGVDACVRILEDTLLEPVPEGGLKQ